MNNLAIAQALVFEPRRAFTELDARPRFWWPLLMLALGSGALALWYTSVVDLEWLVHQQMSSSSFGANMTDAEITRLAQQAAGQQGFRAVLAACANAISIAIGMLVFALYFLLAGKVTGVGRSFRHWFSLACWVTLPSVLALVAAAFVLLTTATRQIPQTSLQPLSLNELFFHRQEGEAGYYLFSYVGVLNFVAVYLGAVAVRAWSGRTWLFSILFNALPLIVIFGAWALFVLR